MVLQMLKYGSGRRVDVSIDVQQRDRPPQRFDEKRQRVLAPPRVQRDVLAHARHAPFAGEVPGIQIVALPGFGQPLEAVEPLHLSRRHELGNVIDRAAGIDAELGDDAIIDNGADRMLRKLYALDLPPTVLCRR